MDERTAQILRDLHTELARLYGPRLRNVILFGSAARGEQREGSDLDVAMVLSDFERPWPEVQRTGQLVSDLSLRYGLTISLLPIRERALREQATPLTRRIAREGVVAS